MCKTMDRKDIKKGLQLLSNISKSKKVKCAAAGAGVIAGILTGAYAAYKYVFHFVDKRGEDDIDLPKGEQYDPMHEKMYSLVREMQAIPYAQVYITSFDGTKLAGKYYHTSDDAPLQIQFHGYHGTGLRDFCGGHKIAREMGHNILVIDERAHGKSEGRTITFGVLERYDCLSWVKYANERFGTEQPIFLVGVSMGAATVLMASELDLPENVAGIIADCPYSSPVAIIRKVGKDMKLPTGLVYPFVWTGARLFGHFKVTKSSAVEAVKNTDIPILLIHGDDDKFVPCDMSREIYEACVSEKMMVTVPGAGHAVSCLVDWEKYESAVQEFIGKCLAEEAAE